MNIAFCYVYTGSNTIGSVLYRIHSVYTEPVRNWNGTVPYGITFISGPIWYQIADPIRQAPCKHKAYPYQFRTGSKPIRPSVNAVLISYLNGSPCLVLFKPHINFCDPKATFTRDWICSDPFGIGSTLFTRDRF